MLDLGISHDSYSLFLFEISKHESLHVDQVQDIYLDLLYIPYICLYITQAKDHMLLLPKI